MELILDSLRRRMRVMHGLWEEAVDTMDLDQVNHVEREPVLPIAFSLFHFTQIEDGSATMLGAGSMIYDDAWAERMGLTIADHGKHKTVDEMVHQRIGDYEAFRASFGKLRPKMELAVDDAGAGFASLRHILELRPAYVKLDRSLIAGLESDEARQAMIVGLRHFARSVGCRLVAEGIETEAELAVLRSLEIELAQGFLLGRPLPVAAQLTGGQLRAGS